MPQHHPIATWSPERDLWEGEEDIFGHSVVFSETLPKRGMTVGGRLYELPMSVPRTTDRGCSSSPHLPTPEEHLRKKPGRKRVTDLRILVENGLLQTGGELPSAVCHLPTPAASDSTGGGQHPSKRVGHSRQLIDYVLSIGDSTDPLFDVGSD